ncbi:MAG: tRNA (N(6)-L-threonylcarbamoyladenosine(37)-C(2))-methylthiotransferase MtaB [bacterium]
MKFRIYTFGCKTNQYDSESLRRTFLQFMEEAIPNEAPEFIIVNTCAVTHIAERKARTLIRHLLRVYPQSKFVVTGCYAERDPERIREMGDITVIGNREKEKIPSLLFPNLTLNSPVIDKKNKKIRAFVKIQDGCDDFCSYCIVPYVRGRVRSRSTEEIIEEIKSLVELNYPEIVLTGIHIGRFEDDGKRLPDLVRLINKEIPNIKRIRLSSLEPQEVDESIIELFKDIPNLCPHIHLVAQSGSNKVLKDMKRKYTREEYLSLIEKFRSVRKDIEFTTDIIVGFPTEEENDFRNTVSLIEEIGFIKVHIFPFSPRPGTEAFNLMPIDKKIIKEREELLKEKSLEVAYTKLKKFLHTPQNILAEDFDNGIVTGFTPTYVRVYARSDLSIRVGTILPVVIDRVEKLKDNVVLSGFIA